MTQTTKDEFYRLAREEFASGRRSMLDDLYRDGFAKVVVDEDGELKLLIDKAYGFLLSAGQGPLWAKDE